MYERFVAVLALAGSISDLSSNEFLGYVSSSYEIILSILDDQAPRVRYAAALLYQHLASQAYQVILHSEDSLNLFFSRLRGHLIEQE